MAEIFVHNAPVRDKTLWMYDGLSHAITYEKEIYEILIRVQGWVLERLDRS